MVFTELLEFTYTIFNGLYNAVQPVIEFMNFQIPFLDNLTVGSVLFGGGFVVYATWSIVNWVIPL